MTKRLAQATAGVALLYAARRYYRNWGTTKDECRIDLPGDELVGQPAVQTTEGRHPATVRIGHPGGGRCGYRDL